MNMHINFQNFSKKCILNSNLRSHKVNTTVKLVLLLINICVSTTCLVSCSSKKKDMYVGLSAEQIYTQGKNNVQKGKFSDAVKDFEALESNYPYGNYADKAKLALMHAYYSKKEYPQAKATADRFVRIYPNHVHVDYAHYMQGLSGYDQYYSTVYRIFKIDRSRREPTFAVQSFDDFKVLLERFPASKYALDARQRMLHLRNQLAFHELYIAQYYLDKRAYLAAANRANLIISDFDETLAIEPALNIMAKAYSSLGMPELERNAVNLLNANFSSISSSSATEK